MCDPRTVENRALEDYRKLVGKALYVEHVIGYTNRDFSEDVFGNFIVQIEETDERDILRWVDDWLDPVYNVIVLYPKDVCVRLCWIMGRSYNQDGVRTQPGDTPMEGE